MSEQIIYNLACYGERFKLHASGALYWKRKRWLIISDVHLGKSAHFRKQGMAVPNRIDIDDLKKVANLIKVFNPNRVLFLGDLFHAEYNSAWERLASFTNNYRKGLFYLILGNHDVLSDWHYGRSNLIVQKEMNAGPFLFTHIPAKLRDGKINICGHLHPGVLLHGRARQRIHLSAFFFRMQSIIVPAFGRFTGSISIKPKKDDIVVGIAENELVRIQ